MSRASLQLEYRLLSPEQQAAAQRTFHIFMLFNVCSFQLLSGNLITLFGLRIGLGNILLGVLFAVIPLAQLMPIIGRLFINRLGNMRAMGLFRSASYIMAAPLLIVALLASTGQTTAAIALLFIGVLGFNLMRGAGMAGMQPLIGYLTNPEDRGRFLSRMQLIIHGVIIITGLMMSLVLDRESPLAVFTLILTVGLVAGIIATFYLLRLPELPREKRAASLLEAVSGALRAKTMRGFLILIAGVFAGSFMVGPFFIVFLRHVYGMGDNTIMLVTVVGSIGAISMALLSGLMTDRIGAQPLLVISAASLSATMLPLVLAPPLPTTAAWIYGAMAFFVFMSGTSGVQSSSNVYFLSICKADQRLNLGILYLLATGLGGAVGAMAGGALLEMLERGIGVINSFRVYFAVLMVVFAVIAFGMSKLDRLGAYRARDVLLMMFSIRDLRALKLVNQLQRVRSSLEETQLIQELGLARSRVTAHELIRKISSPKFAVRAEALKALRNTEVHKDLAPALINELCQHDFTTAHLAADLAGQKSVTEAIPALRESLGSRDFFLASKAMVALAQLGDRPSVSCIEQVLANTENPRLIIHAATALELFGSAPSIPVLIGKLSHRFATYVHDELILAIAAIMGAGSFLYLHYRKFLESADAGLNSLRDELTENTHPRKPREQADKMLDLMNNDHERFAKASRELLADLSSTELDASVAEHLAVGLADREVLRLDRFRFLVAGIIIRAVRQEPALASERGLV